MAKEQKPQYKEFKIEKISDFPAFIKKHWLIFVLIALISFVVYGNALNGEFLNIDDQQGLVYKQEVRDFSGSLKTLELDKIYIATIYKFFGMNSTAYHVGSLLLHILSVSAAFVFFYALFGFKVAILSTLLFMLHPMNSETVCWLSARSYTYITIFGFPIFTLWSLFRKYNDKKSFIACMVIYAIAMKIVMSPWLLTIPIIVFLMDIFFYNIKPFKNVKKLIKDYIWIILFTLFYVGTFIYAEFFHRVSELTTRYYFDPSTSTPYLNRLPYTIFMAIKNLVYPVELSIYREGKPISNTTYLFMIAVSIAVLLFAVKLWKNNQKQFAGLIIIIYAAVSPSFSPVAIAWLSADRYLYMASAFFALLVVLLLIKLEEKTKKIGLAAGVVLIIASLYAIRVYIRTDDYKSSKNMWIATQKTAPLSYRVYNNLGDVYSEEGNYQLAIQNFQKSVQLKPNYADAVHNLGFTYMQIKDYEKAKYYLQKSFEMNPILYQAQYKLGVIETELGNTDAAKMHFQKCLEVSPENYYCQQGLSGNPEQ